MDTLRTLFSSAINKLRGRPNTSDSEQAYKDLDQGKKIFIAPKSDRYSYEMNADTNYDKDWKPTTQEEKQTLSPEGFHRVGDREQVRENLKSGIYGAALAKAKANGMKGNKAKLEATRESDKQFNDTYKEKQVSVDSTALKSVKYDPETELLQVKFQGGNTEYDYPRVPLEVVQGLMKAPSKGEYFLRNIHDQYSLYGKNHKRKTSKERAAIKKFIKSYSKANTSWKGRESAIRNAVNNRGKE